MSWDFKNFTPAMTDIFKGSTIGFLLKTTGAGFNYCFAIIIARYLDISAVGIFFLALTIVTISSSLSRFGLENASLKFIAIDANEENWTSVKSLYTKSILIVLFNSICITLMLWTAAPYLALKIFSNPLLETPLKWMALMVIPHALLWMHAEFLKGMSKISYSQLVQGTFLPFFAFCTVFFFRYSIDLQQVIVIYLFSTITTCILGFFFWFKTIPASPSKKNCDFPTQKLLNSSIPLFVGSIMNLIILWGATLILGSFESSSEIGIFSVVQRTSTLISFVLLAVNSIAASKFATLFYQDDIQGLSQIARFSTQIMTVTAGPLLLICLFKPEWILFLFGKEFMKGTTLLVILAAGQSVNVLTGSVGFLLMMSGNEKYQRNNLICSAFLNIILCFIFIPRMGAVGAAIATAITMSFTNLFAAFLVYKKLKIITLPVNLEIFKKIKRND